MCPDFDLPDSKFFRDDGTPAVLGDGICDFIPQYMTEECGFEYGDCEECKVEDPTKLGDGRCDGGKTPEMKWSDTQYKSFQNDNSGSHFILSLFFISSHQFRSIQHGGMQLRQRRLCAV